MWIGRWRCERGVEIHTRWGFVVRGRIGLRCCKKKKFDGIGGAKCSLWSSAGLPVGRRKVTQKPVLSLSKRPHQNAYNSALRGARKDGGRLSGSDDIDHKNEQDSNAISALWHIMAM
jgi:hypothetical protein